jgi:hypothetical protein
MQDLIELLNKVSDKMSEADNGIIDDFSDARAKGREEAYAAVIYEISSMIKLEAESEAHDVLSL